MAKLAPFDEWERPWKDDEFDAEKAAKLIYNLHKDKERLTTSVTTLKAEKATLQDEYDDLQDTVETSAGTATGGAQDADQAKIDAAVKAALAAAGVAPKSRKEQRKESEAASGGTNLDSVRLEIALDMGLTKAQAKRLVGSTREELEADAEAYIEEHGLGSTDGEEGKTGGKEGQAPPSQRAQVKVKTGSGRGGEEPDPDMDLDPGALYDKVHGRA